MQPCQPFYEASRQFARGRHIFFAGAEADVVRANLSKCGVKEILTLIVEGFGYIVVVEPTERSDTEKRDHDSRCEFTEQGRTDFHILLKRLNDLAWQAWAVVHKVTLPGQQRLISEVKSS